jgi:ribosomal small subunit protein bTHX
MGKGDPKSKRGKIAKGSYGVRRPKRDQNLKTSSVSNTSTSATSAKVPAQKASAEKKGGKKA